MYVHVDYSHFVYFGKTLDIINHKSYALYILIDQYNNFSKTMDNLVYQ